MNQEITTLNNERAKYLSSKQTNFAGAVYASNVGVSEGICAVVLQPNIDVGISGVYTPTLHINGNDLTEKLSNPTYYATISCTGASALSVIDEHNYLGLTATWAYTSTGTLTLTLSPSASVSIYDQYFQHSNNYEGPSFTSASGTTAGVITLKCFGSTGVAANLFTRTSFQLSLVPKTIVKGSTATSLLYNMVALENGQDQIYNSFYGDTWYRGELAPTTAGQNWVDSLYSSYHKLFIAVGDAGTDYDQVTTSPDGLTWTHQSSVASSLSLKAITAAGATVVAVGSTYSTTPCILYSTTGLSWTKASSIATTWADVTYGAGYFIAVGASGSTTTPIARSTDGITWTGVTGSGLTGSYTGVEYGPSASLFVAVGNTRDIFKSTTGLTYTLVSAAYTPNGAIAYSPTLNKWIIGNGSNALLCNSDLSSITTVATIGTLTKIIWSKQVRKFIGIDKSSTSIYYSEDGSAWHQVTTSASGNFSTVASI